MATSNDPLTTVTTSCGSSKTSSLTSSNGPTSLAHDWNSRNHNTGAHDSNFIAKCKTRVSATVIGHNIYALQSPRGTSLTPPSSNVQTQNTNNNSSSRSDNISGNNFNTDSKTSVTTTVIGCNNHHTLHSPGGTSTVLPSSSAPTQDTSFRNDNASGSNLSKTNMTATVTGSYNNYLLYSPGGTSAVSPSSSAPTQNTSDMSSTRNDNASGSNFSTKSKTSVTATVTGRNNHHALHSPGGISHPQATI